MTAYTVTAFPTIYRGQRYRSRLEARWAAFFDLMAWPFEYEPFDLGHWTPDFMLRGDGGGSALVEVKPTERGGGDDVAADFDRAYDRGLISEDTVCISVGVGPFHLRYEPFPSIGYSRLRWGNAASRSWYATVLAPQPSLAKPRTFIDAIVPSGATEEVITGFRGVLTGKPRQLDGDARETLAAVAVVREAWAAATNIVQWAPKGGRT